MSSSVKGTDPIKRIEEWRLESATSNKISSTTIAQDIFRTSMGLFNDILTLMENAEPDDRIWIRKARRTYNLLEYWGTESGMSNGSVDRHLQDSYRAKRTALEVLLAIAKVLSKGGPHSDGDGKEKLSTCRRNFGLRFANLVPQICSAVQVSLG